MVVFGAFWRFSFVLFPFLVLGSHRPSASFLFRFFFLPPKQCSHRTAFRLGEKMAVVFLHGLGDTPEGWSSLRREIPMFHKQAGIGPVDPPLRFEFPGAPTASVTISGGQMQTSWFDLFDWPIGLKARDDRDGLMASVKTVHALVDKLVSEGIPASKIVVGGFSQGGAIALLATYFYPARLAGCVCLSGWLTMRDTFEKSLQSENKNTPCYWGHGFMDQVNTCSLLYTAHASLLRVLNLAAACLY